MSVRTPPAVGGPSSILRRNPYSSRRSFIARAMALEPIGDIADVNLTGTTTETLTWETAADWNGAASANEVVHNSLGDRVDAEVWLGWDPDLEPWATNGVTYLPLDEDSGSTAADVIGSEDFSISGATVGQTGLLGSTGYTFDGNDDSLTATSSVLDIAGNKTVCAFGRMDGQGGGGFPRIYQKGTGSSGRVFEIWVEDGNGTTKGDAVLRFNQDTGSASTQIRHSISGFAFGDLHFYAGVHDADNNQARLHIDGTDVNTASHSAGLDSDTNHFIGNWNTSSDRGWNGLIEEFMVFDAALTESQLAAIYQAITSGNLETATKSFTGDKSPDLQNLDYSLNAESITLDVIGSPGTASEEVVSQTLDGATSYTLTWSAPHTDFRVDIKPSTTDHNTTPVVNRVELVA